MLLSLDSVLLEVSASFDFFFPEPPNLTLDFLFPELPAFGAVLGLMVVDFFAERTDFLPVPLDFLAEESPEYRS